MGSNLRSRTRWDAGRMAGIGCLLLALLGPRSAAAVDWNEMAGVDTITITTTNEDGTPRETTIWLLVLDGYPYIRTGNTHWGANAERNPNVRLHAGQTDLVLKAVPIKDPVLHERIQQGFHDKYGWSDAVIRLLPDSGTKLFRLDPQPGS